MKKISYIVLLAFSLSMVGCTSTSTKLAQEGSFRTQSVKDGVHRDMSKALSRENYETAKLEILLSAANSKIGLDAESQKVVDNAAAKSIAALTTFAQKRDFQVEWDRDYERANAYKYVTVDAKLFSEQGIANYIVNTLSEGSKKLFGAFDKAKETWNATKPAN